MKQATIGIITIFSLILLSTYVSAELIDGLVLYWSLDEISGTNVIDSTNHYNATTTGNPTIEAGLLGNAKRITGAGQCWNTSGLAVSGRNTGSISWWQKIPGAVVDGQSQWDYLRDGGGLYADLSTGSTALLKAGNQQVTHGAIISNSNMFHHYVWTYTATSDLLYVDGVLTVNGNHAARTVAVSAGDFYWVGYNCGTGAKGTEVFDEIGIWDRVLSSTEVGILYNSGAGFNFYVSNTNTICTSCNPPFGDAYPPYETDDTTPTFKFNTTNAMACRIGDTNNNYTTMSSSRDCDAGQNLSIHTCTLTVQDGLVDYNVSVYISCNYNETNNATMSLPMLISSLELPNSTEAIMQGIENSVVGQGATIYSNQKVYLRLLNGTNMITTVNKVVAYGNQRWLINYVNATGTTLGLFNITPVVYTLDMKNMTAKAIRANVTAFINSTKI